MKSQLFDCWVFCTYYVYTISLLCLISVGTIMFEGKKDKAEKRQPIIDSN